MNEPRLDLNLLTVFDTLIDCGSVTAAAVRLNLSQPAVSHALNRLRKVTGDPLFVRSGQGLAPTPRALAMRNQSREIVDGARALLSPASFDPVSDQRTFRVAASDYAHLTLVPALLRRFRTEAPMCKLEIVQVGPSTLSQLENGELDVSFWGREFPGSPYLSMLLFEEHLVGVAGADHPLLNSGAVSLDAYCSVPHAVVGMGVGVANPVEILLDAAGRTRDIRFSGQSFAGALTAIRNSDMVMALPSRLMPLAQSMGYNEFPVPLSIDH